MSNPRRLILTSLLVVALPLAAALSQAADKKPTVKPATSGSTAAPAVTSAAPATTAAPASSTTGSAQAAGGAPGASTADPAASDPATPAVKPKPAPPPHDKGNPNDPRELPDTWYLFLGARYRGNILPKFLLNVAVNEGATVYSNSIGIEAEFRKNGFSIIPALTFTEFGLDNTLFLEKGKADGLAGNWSVIDSGLKGIYGSVDLLWSKQINKYLDFEFGLGIGFGTTFGSLKVNWVYDDPNGQIVSSGGRRFSECQTEASGPGCTTRDHSFAKVAKVGGYNEPSWFNGGSKPSFLPMLTLPNLGLRIKPVRQFVGRVQLGFSLTGFWFGFSGSFGFPGKKASPKSNEGVEVEETVE